MTQAKPTKGKRAVFPDVFKRLADRILYGIETYGRPLETHNGRSSLRDAIEESLDQPVYLVQLEAELRDARDLIQRGEVGEGLAILDRVLGE